MKNQQGVQGNNNTTIQVQGSHNNIASRDLYITNYNFCLSEFRAFEKVLYSIPPERFLEEILMPYLSHVAPNTSICEFKKMLK